MFFIGGKSLPVNHAQKVFPNGTLVVENVQPGADAGQYTCIARNKQGQSARKTVNVKVSGLFLLSRYLSH